MEIRSETDRRTAVRTARRPARRPAARFPLGRLVATPGALGALPIPGILALVRRHATGDWGDVCADDAEANEDALRVGARVFSVYVTEGGKLWVITEADRSVTTVLLPDEY